MVLSSVALFMFLVWGSRLIVHWFWFYILTLIAADLDSLSIIQINMDNYSSLGLVKLNALRYG